jgi:hypothetical protein
MITFILVHGTFARKASFTLKDSALRRALQTVCDRYFERASFVSTRWSGRNLASDRIVAAQQIATEIRRLPASHGPIFLLGHSHGGNAIAYFLKQYPELGSMVCGAAFLSTPFVAMRLRDYWTDIAKVLSCFPALVLWVGFACICAHTWDSLAEWSPPATEDPFPFGLVARSIEFVRHSDPISRIAMQSVGFLLAALTLGRFLHKRFWKRGLRVLRSRLRRQVRSQQTVQLPRGNYIFLRATGDEAAAALSTIQAIAWIFHRAFYSLSLSLSSVVELVEMIWKSWWGKIPCLIAALYIFGLLVFFQEGGRSLPLILKNMVLPGGNFGGLELFIFYDNVWVGNFIAIYELLIRPGLAFMTLASIVVAGLFVTTAILSMGASRAFGWRGPLESIFVEFAVEPVPAGITTIHHVPWQLSSSGLLMHSAPYDDDVSLKYLAEWVGKGLRDRFSIASAPTQT